MLSSRTRSSILALLLLLLAAAIVAGVGRNAPGSAPDTYLDAIGRWDAEVDAWIRSERTAPIVDVSKVLDVVGSAVVTVPVRIALLLVLAALRRFSAFVAFAATWAISAFSTEGLKLWLHRGRPPEPLVDAMTYAMPSGHAVAITSIGVATAIALATGWWRGGLVLLAIAAGAAMGASRLVVSVHWASDAVAGVLFGAGVAIATAVLVDRAAEAMPDRSRIRRGRG